MTSNGSQNTIILTQQPEFPWLAHEQLFAVPLNNKFIGTDQLLANMQNQIVQLQHASNESNLGISITANWGGNNTPSLGPYMLIATAPYDFTVLSMDMSVGDGGGSFVITIYNAGIAIPGLENVLVASQQRQQVLAAANQVVTRGSEFSMRISAIIGFPLNSWININGTTNAFSEPVIGIATGTSLGMSTTLGVGTSTQLGQAMAASVGNSLVQAIGLTAVTRVATAAGVAIVQGVGVQVAIGSSAGFASGSSTAHAVGTSTIATHVFVMDDPLFGILDTNPLD